MKAFAGCLGRSLLSFWGECVRRCVALDVAPRYGMELPALLDVGRKLGGNTGAGAFVLRGGSAF